MADIAFSYVFYASFPKIHSRSSPYFILLLGENTVRLTCFTAGHRYRLHFSFGAAVVFIQKAIRIFLYIKCRAVFVKAYPYVKTTEMVSRHLRLDSECVPVLPSARYSAGVLCRS